MTATCLGLRGAGACNSIAALGYGGRGVGGAAAGRCNNGAVRAGRYAVAKAADKGDAFAGAMSVKPGVWLYQLTDDGLALELTAKGTKYYKDDELN